MSVPSKLGQINSSTIIPASNTYINDRVVGIDVECLATGPGHNDRAPCWAVMLELDEKKAQFNTLIDLKMKPDKIFDYMEALSGVNKASLTSAVDEASGLNMVQQ